MNRATPDAITQIKPTPSLVADFPGYIIVGCVLFNFLLCFANTKLLQVSSAHVIVSELMLVGAALVLGARQVNPEKFYWLTVLFLQIVLMLVLSMAKETLLAKPLRDVLILPVFMMLGLSARNVRFTGILLGLSAFISVIALYEALATGSFVNWFNVADYFIAKGASNDFSYVDSGLFVSSVRPGGKFLLDLGFHRVSSVFLEPVSLGFYGFIAGAYAIAARSSMQLWQYVALLALSYFLIWIADGRMAFGALTILLVAKPVFRFLSRWLNLFLFPALLTASALVYHFGLLSFHGEGAGARIYSTLEKLENTDIAILFGVSHYPEMTVDSALLEMLNNHGIIGLLLFWLSPLVFKATLPTEAKIYLFGVSLFISFGFLFSAAIFTIKTAALLWFVYGYLIVTFSDTERKPVKDAYAD